MGNPAPLTPMLAQYLDLKRQYADAILFYRMGDFYEMFFDDAKLAAPVLEVQLTSRDKNADNPIAMCGVPHHSAMGYIQKLLNAGHKVALCEQLENPASAKGIVKRDVVRVLTPSLIGDPDLAREDQSYYLLSLSHKDGRYGICVFDLLDGTLRSGSASSWESVAEVIREYQPKELLADASTAEPESIAEWNSLVVTRRPNYFTDEGTPEERAHAALRLYLNETQKQEVASSLAKGLPLFGSENLALDSVTLASLEIVRPATEGGKSLAQVMDHTVTPMGRRLIREWLSHPLRSREAIETRLERVTTLLAQPNTCEALRSLLSPMRDLERLSTKTSLGLAQPRDLGAIREVLARLPDLKELLSTLPSPEWKQSSEELDSLDALQDHLQKALQDELPHSFREAGIFRSEFHPEIAEYRSLSHDAKSTIAAMETREKERTGIASLKIKYNRVFGYTIEITQSQLSRVPADYIRKQTLSTGERYITEELKRFEEKVISSEHRLKTLEESLFLETRARVSQSAPSLSANARLIAEIDVLQSFASVARKQGFCRPEFVEDGRLDIQDGRHPVVETLLAVGTYVPNSISMSDDEARTLIVTGPNMGGKSTIMRQVALICSLAQTGSFVPASRAELPLLDAIFTRIGSSDDLARGRSTFMVEMNEVARILENATERSLILIDEIGRGTSTYDGLALAWSLLEYLHGEIGAKTLFATHFHEITSLEASLPGVKNVNVLVDKWDDEVVFLYRLAVGVCNRSYGIEVAKLAGLPPKVLSRARDIQGLLETHSQRAQRSRSAALIDPAKQMGFFDDAESMERPVPLGT